MRVRRAMVLVVLVGAVVAGLVVDRHRPSSTAGVFGTVALPLMPTASTGDALTASWFCPGAPAGDSGGPSGFVSILNPSDSPTRATLTVVPTEGEPVTKELALPERSRQEVRLADVVVAHYAAALVETVSSTVLVEQTSEAALDPTPPGLPPPATPRR